MTTTRKILGPDGEPRPRRHCRHPQHTPPPAPRTSPVFTPGTWEHLCPSCGHRETFVVAAEKTSGTTGLVTQPLSDGPAGACPEQSGPSSKERSA